jgi:hypothetical protein
MAKIDVNVSQS